MKIKLKELREKEKISLENALDFFYKSELYQLISQGISDMHCRSDLYLIDELENEYKTFQRKEQLYSFHCK